MAHAAPAALLAGLLPYLAAVVLGHCDGEVARLTLAESSTGEWLDLASDTVVHAALVLALGVAPTRTGFGLAAGIMAAVGVVASAAVGKAAAAGSDDARRAPPSV